MSLFDPNLPGNGLIWFTLGNTEGHKILGQKNSKVPSVALHFLSTAPICFLQAERFWKVPCLSLGVSCLFLLHWEENFICPSPLNLAIPQLN